MSRETHLEDETLIFISESLPDPIIGSGAKVRKVIVAEKAVVSRDDAEADPSKCPVSQDGIVIVGVSERRRRRRASWQSSRLP